YIFWLLVGYVGCGLGLLMTTSFLGLRRYMHLRKLRMPRTMTGTWLGFGAATVVLLLLAGAFLPRPDSKFLDPKDVKEWLSWLWPSNEDKPQEDDASDYAVVDGQGGKGDGSGQGVGQKEAQGEQGQQGQGQQGQQPQGQGQQGQQ